jgi:choline-glycine betaine transporter
MKQTMKTADDKMSAKKKTVMAFILLAMVMSLFSAAHADIPKEKSEPLANVLKSSFRERDYDQSAYKSNKAAKRPDEQQARAELKSIHIEIGDGLAGKGKLVKIEEL